MSTPLTLRTISRPGNRWSRRGLARLVGEMQQLADRCLDEKTRYQALSGEREALKRALIVTARDRDGALVGFCSGVLLLSASDPWSSSAPPALQPGLAKLRRLRAEQSRQRSTAL